MATERDELILHAREPIEQSRQLVAEQRQARCGAANRPRGMTRAQPTEHLSGACVASTSGGRHLEATILGEVGGFANAGHDPDHVNSILA